MGIGFAMILLTTYLVPILVCTVIILGILRTVKEWHHNENSPQLTVDASIVCKRSDYRRTMNARKRVYRGSRTNYYVTFQVESGDRMELELQGHQYGLLTEGDKGKLTFQGKRFLNFERVI